MNGFYELQFINVFKAHKAHEIIRLEYYSKGLSPSVNIYYQLISAWLDIDKHDEAERALKEYRYSGAPFSLKLSELFVDYFLRHNDVNAVLQTVTEIKFVPFYSTSVFPSLSLFSFFRS
jgi:hypothetical protein